MSRKASKYLYDIARSIQDIFEDYLDGIDTLEQYEADKTIRLAVINELEIVEEAAYRLRNLGITFLLPPIH